MIRLIWNDMEYKNRHDLIDELRDISDKIEAGYVELDSFIYPGREAAYIESSDSYDDEDEDDDYDDDDSYEDEYYDDDEEDGAW